MKSLKNLIAASLMLLAFTPLSSCSDDDNPDEKWIDDGSKVELSRQRMFILNEGSLDANNANISYRNLGEGTPKSIDDIFLTQNDIKLGDNGQAMIVYDNSMYVAMFGSNYLLRLNAACVVEKTVYFATDADLLGGVRDIAAADGYIYASFYGGIVAKINASTLTVESKLKIPGGYNFEDVTIEDGSLYVANSYQITSDASGANIYDYKTDVFVVDLADFKVKQTLVVEANPNRLEAEDDKVFLISNNYGRESYVFQMIDPADGNRVSEIAYATDMALGNDKVYLVDSRTDWTTWATTNTFRYYDVKARKLVNQSFLSDAPSELLSSSIYSMAVNDATGDIFIAVTHYTLSNGEVYRFRADGSFVEKFDCGGQNPRAEVFFD